MISATNCTEVTYSFSANGSGRRVIITTGDAKTRQRYQELAETSINTYRNVSQNDVRTQRWTSEYAQYTYKAATGLEVPDKDATYTILSTLDKSHANSKISGYLSYREDGQLMYTPQVFSGDSGQVATCQFGTGEFAEPIYDFTDQLAAPTVVDEKTQALFESKLEVR